MATSTSTIPAFKAAFVAVMTTRLADDNEASVSYAWQPDVKKDALFFGRPEQESVRGRSDLATFKVTRMGRTENYALPFTIRCFKPEGTSSGASVAEARVFALMAEVETALAEDPQMSATVQKAQVGDFEASLEPFEKGHAAEIVLSIECTAQLT